MTPPEDNPKLADQLTRLYTHQPYVPAETDDPVLTAAKIKLTTIRRRRTIFRATAAAAGAAIAATITLIAWLTPTTETPTFAREDLDHNGVINILDAMTLAKHIERNTNDPTHDINHDGQIDHHDVDTIAMAAVTLPDTNRAERHPLSLGERAGVRAKRSIPPARHTPPTPPQTTRAQRPALPGVEVRGPGRGEGASPLPAKTVFHSFSSSGVWGLEERSIAASSTQREHRITPTLQNKIKTTRGANG